MVIQVQKHISARYQGFATKISSLGSRLVHTQNNTLFPVHSVLTSILGKMPSVRSHRLTSLEVSTQLTLNIYSYSTTYKSNSTLPGRYVHRTIVPDFKKVPKV